MYFGQKLKREINRKINTGSYDVYAVKLRTGVLSDSQEELSEIVEIMFRAWKNIAVSRSRGYLKNYDGIIRRLFFSYSAENDSFEPYFYLLCVRKKNIHKIDDEWKVKIEREKLRVQTYIKWFSAWAKALKLCTNVSAGFSLVEIEDLENILSEFCTNEKYTLLPLIDEAKKEMLKQASGNGRHKLVTFHGIFHDRHVSVER